MSASPDQSPGPTRSAVLDALVEACPDLAGELSGALRSTVAHYATIPWTSPPIQRCSPETQAAWDDLVQELGTTTASLGPGAQQILLSQFAATPLIQAGTHCQPLLDRYAFFCNLLFYMGARECGQRYLFTYQSSTNTLESTPGKGPGWLRADERRINIFGLSRRILQKTSVMLLRGPVQCTWAVAEPAGAAVEAYLKELRERFAGHRFDSARQAFVAINTSLWADWGAAESTQHILLDEDFATRVLIRHLERDGVVRKLLSMPSGRVGLALRDEAVPAEYATFTPRGTELFWGIDVSRVRPLVLEDSTVKGNGRTWSLTPDELLESLRRGECVPGLFLQFLVLSILPRVRFTGGLRQCVYYPVFQRQMLNLARSVLADGALADDLHQTLNHWAMRVIEESSQPIERLARGEWSDWERLRRDYGRRSLRESIEDFRVFKLDAKWNQLLRRRNAVRPG